MEEANPSTRLIRLGRINTCLGLFLGLAVTRAAEAQDLSLRFIGQQILPTATTLVGTKVGGRSGITYDPLTQHYHAISARVASHPLARRLR